MKKKLLLPVALVWIGAALLAAPVYSSGDDTGVVSPRAQQTSSNRFSQAFRLTTDTSSEDNIFCLIDPNAVGSSRYLFITGIRTNLNTAAPVYYIMSDASPAEFDASNGVADGVMIHIGRYAANGGEYVDACNWLHSPRDGTMPYLLVSAGPDTTSVRVAAAPTQADASDKSLFHALDQDDDFWNGGSLRVLYDPTTSDNIGETRTISDFADTNNEITVSTAFGTALAANSIISVTPPMGLGLYCVITDSGSAVIAEVTVDYVLSARR